MTHTAPRDDLVRMSSTLRASEDGNTLFGYAAVFDTPTEINSWEGRFSETIAKGAFGKTLRENGPQVKVLFNHGMDPQIGDKPLGKPAVMKEDDRGLYVEVPLDDTSYNGDIKALLRSGALDGMSFRMSVKREDWDDLDADVPKRTIKEVRLYEFGPVTFPAYAATQAGIRAGGTEAYALFRAAYEAEHADDPKPAESDEVERSDEAERSDDPATTATASEEPPEGHPDEDRQDAPPDEGHPSTATTDAPPDAGHPSHPRRQRLERERRDRTIAYARELRDLSRKRFDHYERQVEVLEATREEV